MFPKHSTPRLLLGALLLAAPAAFAQGAAARPSTRPPASTSVELPVKYVGKPTKGPISAADLMTRLYVFADDSMMGREVGTVYNLKGTAYIEHEVRRMGLVPAGDSGTYFQNLPVFTTYVDSSSAMAVDGQRFVNGSDFLLTTTEERRLSLDGLPVVYGGSSADTMSWPSAASVAGKIVVVTVPTLSSPTRIGGPRFLAAAAVMLVSLDRLNAPLRAAFARPRTGLRKQPAPVALPTALTMFVSSRLATALFGTMDSLKPGMAGKTLQGLLHTRQTQAPGRNVVAILPGSDATLKGQYVAIGAHNDHVGFNNRPVDHDSIRALNAIARVQGADNPEPAALTVDQQSRFRSMVDSLHALHPARLDSIFNGADDDGTGSVSVLEIAEKFASEKTRPKRSILFVWHAGEEKGLWGSEYYTDHPTVPRDSIIAQLNMDMVGRGKATDVTGETKAGQLTHGGPGYLQLVGSRRVSTELGDLIESVNASRKLGFRFDYSMDANGHPQNIYCRSDHYEYARYGIPIVFFTTGGHSDYHQVTDEPQYIDYQHMSEVATLVHDAATAVANLAHRVVVDHSKADPKGACVQ